MAIDDKTVESDLRKLEQIIDALNFDYTLLARGEIKQVSSLNESIIKNLINKYRLYQIRNFALRNKYNGLVAKYYSFKTKWRKLDEFIPEKVLDKERIDELLDIKLKNINVKDPARLKELIKHRLIGLIEDGHKFKDFEISAENNKVEIKIF